MVGRSFSRAVGLCLFALSQAAGASTTQNEYSAPQVFDLATRAQNANDTATAITLYRALEHDPSVDVRCEARFRHGQLLEAQKQYADAAVLFRAVLDEKPDATRVRLELAKVLALSGRQNAARRELRAAQAGGLPPDVARLVNQFQAALRSAKPFGGSLELGFAPSTNINRATSATTLNTVIAPLDLSADARAQSGVGLNIGGQVYAQIPLSRTVRVTARVLTQNAVYRASQFDDSNVSGELGVALDRGKSRWRLTAGPSYRLFGQHPYASAFNTTLNWQRPLGTRSQIEAQGDFSVTRFETNPLQNGHTYGGSLSIEHAMSARFGGKLTLLGQRQTADDPGYATLSGGAAVTLWREIGKLTAFGSAQVNHLDSDARLFLYLDRRREWLYRASLGASVRHIKVAGFSPVVRLSYERNISTVGIYDYHRLGGELAISRAF